MVDYGNGQQVNYTYDAGGNLLTAQLTSVQQAVYYHIYGDVLLNGADKAGTTVRINGDSTDLTGIYGQTSDTVYGKVYVGDKGVDRIGYYFDVPNGTYTISAASGGQTASITVTTNSNTSQDLGYGTYYMQQVDDITLSAQGPTLSLDSNAYALMVGQTHNTVVTVAYSDGRSYDVTNYCTYESSAPWVATVNADGLVTGVSVGNTVIRAVYGGIEATAAVSVYQTGGGGDGGGSVNPSQPSVVGQVYANGNPVEDIEVFFNFDQGQKLAQLQLKKNGTYELNGTYDANTVFTIKLNNNGFTPYIVLGAGDIQSWSDESGVTTISVKGVRFKPNQALEVQLGVILAVQYGPLQEVFPSEYRGMYISTNGNQFATPYKDPVTQKLGVMIGGVDGESGFFKAFLPDALLQSWGVTSPSQLQAFVGDENGNNRQKVNAPNVAQLIGGATIVFDLSFSVHQIFIDSQDDITAPVYQSISIDSTNKEVTITFNENLINNKANVDELKTAVTLATDGINFTALGTGDTVVIVGNTLVVTFNSALTGNNNKIKVAANTLKDENNNVLTSDVITENISAHLIPPTFVSAATNAAGTAITVTFSKAMANPAGKHAEFTVTVNGVVTNVIAATLNNDPQKIDLKLANPVVYGDTVTVGYTAGTVMAEDGGVLASFAGQTVTNNAPKPIVAPTVEVDNNNKNLAITDSTPSAVTLTVPGTVTDATINVAKVLNEPVGNTVNTDPLPQINIQAITPVSSNPVQIIIPQGTVVTAAADNWDGTINVPTVKPNNSVTVTPDPGKTATVSTVIEVGFGDVPLTFSRAVRLLIPGQAGKEAGYYRGSTFTKITTVLSADTQATGDTLPEGGDGKIDAGSDLVIWTKHFTKFVTYTQTATSGTNGGGGGGIVPVSNQVEKPIQAGTTTIVEIPGKVKVEVPAGTVTGSKASVVVETMSDTKAGGAGMPLLSQVVGVKLKNGTMAGRIKITLHFDKNKLGKGQEPVAFYDAGGRWSRLEGNVDHDRGTVTLSVDHLTLFAVFAVTKETPKPVVTFNDIQGHWAETTINKLAGMGVVSGYPDGTFKPENTITRAEVTAILVRALKFKPGTNGLSQFADEANIPIWARQFVAAAVSEGLLKGYPHPDGTATFEADRPVSRAELAVMTARIINNKFGKVNQSNIRFSDANNIPEWARGAVGTLVAKNIVSGYPDNTFRAENLVTRAEAALIIVRLLELK
ncbi:MAG: S-layer homology domain-containing protein [Bacillota bacterium]|nr:S-layer homology domain-containing protein [Bacillota bacterium]